MRAVRNFDEFPRNTRGGLSAMQRFAIGGAVGDGRCVRRRNPRKTRIWTERAAISAALALKLLTMAR